jgi:hypothetical protein
MTDKLEKQQALRKEAGAKIDPNTADVWFRWGVTIDPYGDYDDLRPEEWFSIGVCAWTAVAVATARTMRDSFLIVSGPLVDADAD